MQRELNLVGVDSNAFSIMGYVIDNCCLVGEDKKAYIERATSGNYEKLLEDSCIMIGRENERRRQECDVVVDVEYYYYDDNTYFEEEDEEENQEECTDYVLVFLTLEDLKLKKEDLKNKEKLQKAIDKTINKNTDLLFSDLENSYEVSGYTYFIDEVRI